MDQGKKTMQRGVDHHTVSLNPIVSLPTLENLTPSPSLGIGRQFKVQSPHVRADHPVCTCINGHSVTWRASLEATCACMISTLAFRALRC